MCCVCIFFIAPLNARVNVESGVHFDDQHKPTEREPSVEETKLQAELLSKDQKCKVPSSGNVDNVMKVKSESSQQTSEPDPDSGIFVSCIFFLAIFKWENCGTI